MYKLCLLIVAASAITMGVSKVNGEGECIKDKTADPAANICHFKGTLHMCACPTG